MSENTELLTRALDDVLAATTEMQRVSVLMVDAERRLAGHEARMGTADDPGHIKLGTGFEREDDGTLNFIGKAAFDGIIDVHNQSASAHAAATAAHNTDSAAHTGVVTSLRAETSKAISDHNAAMGTHPDIRTDLAEAKEPKPHAATHAKNGTDPLNPNTIGLNVSVEPTPGSIPVRDASGNVKGNITGNATYA